MKLRKIRIHHEKSAANYWIDSSWDIKDYPPKWFKAYGGEDSNRPNIDLVFMFNSDLIEAIEWTDIYHNPS